MLASAPRGKPVVSRADGVQIERVEDVVFDSATRGPRDDVPSYSPAPAVMNIGHDAVS